ncbi:hypothetical protein N7478_002101 [Penicillium angulare]|uniref:uncharacterized protein n=1 Tax=Penicillium angulare TaxID=116970 RepID=UPI0025410602|nr:uncharacterized protein N7478_002101 [Penicillium angulare]KAJ5289071.1 hypothetical protein N7478_002101 [Penicillium angulare]
MASLRSLLLFNSPLTSYPGSDNEKARLENEVASYDPEPYWSYYHPKLLSTNPFNLLASPKPEFPSQSISDQDGGDSSTRLPPHKAGAKESISAFLSRLPPSITPLSTAGPWIWTRGRAAKSLSKSLESREEAKFVKEGTELLSAFDEKEAELRAVHDESGAKTTSGLTRKLNVARKELESDILSLARGTGITAGKWMLFPSVQMVDSTWKTIVKALDKGDVCADAKVATNDGSDQSRLICVYTEDFGDKDDVKRVLQMLAREQLFNPRERPIYYKADAYTLLEINAKNRWQLKASMYSSKDFRV